MHAKGLSFCLVTVVSLAGCTDSVEPGTLTIQVSSTNIAVAQGDSAVMAISVERANLEKAVTLTLEGLPAGVSATFTPSDVPVGVTSSVLVLQVSSVAAPDSLALVVRAVADGVPDQTAVLSLKISVKGSYTLTALAPIVAAQGGAGSGTVLVQRSDGFAGSVALSATGVPAGVTATVGPTTSTGRSAPLRFTATNAAAAGTYTVSVKGTSAGLSERSADFTLTIIAPPATSSMTLPFCTAPVWVAFQNEGYEWQRVVPSGASVTFAATDRLGVVWVSQVGNAAEVFVRYASRAEVEALHDPTFCPGTKSLSGSVSGVASGQVAVVAAGLSARGANPTATGFSLTNLPSGPVDLMAARGQPGGLDGPNGPASFNPDRLIVRRSIDLPSGSALAALDFDGAESVSPASTSLTITNLPNSESTVLVNSLWTANGTIARVFGWLSPDPVRPVDWVPSSHIVAGDLHELWIDAYPLNDGSIRRSLIRYAVEPADLSVTLGPHAGFPTMTSIDVQPYARTAATLASHPDYGGAARFVLGGLAGGARNVHVLISSAYLGAMPATWSFVVPDLTAADGFQASWMPTSGQVPYYQVDVYSKMFRVRSNAGDVIRFAARAGFNSASATSLRKEGIRLVR